MYKTKLSTLQQYEQLARIGPRRSGRTVGNIGAAINAKQFYGGATIVVAHHSLVEHTKHILQSHFSYVPESDWPAITTLASVAQYRGPFFVDHYANERIHQRYNQEIGDRDDEIAQLKRVLAEYEGRFR